MIRGGKLFVNKPKAVFQVEKPRDQVKHSATPNQIKSKNSVTTEPNQHWTTSIELAEEWVHMVENPATQSEPVQPSAASNPNVVKPNFNKRLAHSNDRGPPLANQIGENHGRKKTNPTNGKSQGTWRGLAPFYRLLFFGFGTFFRVFFLFFKANSWTARPDSQSLGRGAVARKSGWEKKITEKKGNETKEEKRKERIMNREEEEEEVEEAPKVNLEGKRRQRCSSLEHEGVLGSTKTVKSNRKRWQKPRELGKKKSIPI